MKTYVSTLMGNLKRPFAALTLATALLVPTLLPATAAAQDWRHSSRRELRHDQARIRRDQRELRQDRRDYRWQHTRPAYGYNRYGYGHRQATKNQWRNLGYAGGAVGIAGLLTGNRTLAALGLGGGLYSAYRYEQDRRSQNVWERNRYELFRRPSFDYGGHRYVRHDRWQHGQRYYAFSRVR